MCGFILYLKIVSVAQPQWCKINKCDVMKMSGHISPPYCELFYSNSMFCHYLFFPSLHCSSQICRSGVGAPVVGDLDGEYRHDSRKNILEWCLPVIDENNKSGSLEFSIAGRPNDFFPVNVSFVSKRTYSNIQVSRSVYCVTVLITTNMKNKYLSCYYRWPK